MNFFKMIKGLLTSAPRVTPVECAPKILAGQAVLVDVREPDEWSTGFAQGAVLLALSDLTGPREKWTTFLAEARDREIFLYCGAGVRSGMAARVLTSEGFRAANSGSLSGWRDAGWPLVLPGAGSERG